MKSRFVVNHNDIHNEVKRWRNVWVSGLTYLSNTADEPLQDCYRWSHIISDSGMVDKRVDKEAAVHRAPSMKDRKTY